MGNAKKSPAGAGLINFNWFLIAAILLLTVDAGTWAMIVGAHAVFIPPANDFMAYRDAVASWLAGGPFYHPYQLAGSYTALGVSPEPILYPPTILPLLAAFTVLPAIVWWAFPLGVVGYVVARCPSRSRQLLAIALALWPQTIGMVGVGNPGMWIVTALALATIRPAFAPFVLLKPSLAPFALYRIHHRGWWVGFAVFAAISLAFLPLWFDWLRAVGNSDSSLFYSLSNVPPMLIPLVAASSFRTATPP